MRKPPTAAGHVLRCVVVGSAVGMVSLTGIGFVQEWIDRYMDPFLFATLQFIVTLVATMVASRWFVEQYRKQDRWPRPLVTPGDIVGDEWDDPLKRHVIAQAWNTGKPMLGWYDEDGNMHFREREFPRIPITRHDADGTVIDGFAEAMIVMDDGRTMGFQMRDPVDLDGNPLVLPPGSYFEGDVPAVQIVENPDD